jgi:hypothetical protein
LAVGLPKLIFVNSWALAVATLARMEAIATVEMMSLRLVFFSTRFKFWTEVGDVGGGWFCLCQPPHFD